MNHESDARIRHDAVGDTVQTINTLTSLYNHSLDPYEVVGISVYRELERRHTVHMEIHLERERTVIDELMSMLFERLMARSFRLLEEIVSLDTPEGLELPPLPSTSQRERSYPPTVHAEQESECSICLCEIKKDETVYSIPCKHLFHTHCLKVWLDRHNTCPLCRQTMV